MACIGESRAYMKLTCSLTNATFPSASAVAAMQLQTAPSPSAEHRRNPPQPQSLFANDSQLSVYCTHGVAIAATPRFIVGRLTGSVRKSFLPANGSH